MSNLLVIIRPSLRWDVLWYTNVRPSVCPSVRFTCRALTQEPLGQFTSNFTELLELVLRSVYFMVKF